MSASLMSLNGLAWILLAPLLAASSQIIVHTPDSGTIRGVTVQTEAGDNIHEFHNIPYSVPPVGPLRFQPPTRCTVHTCWTGALDATDSSLVACIQITNGAGTEDCLVMTIRSDDLTASKPVIVWIHGGGLKFGSGGGIGYSFDEETTSQLDAVTVNINYRLGYLGFNAFNEFWGDEQNPNVNNGFRDQITALKWIQMNIASFGGNPDAVTIIGESGGATSVLVLVSSPLANGLFHNAVAFSPGPEFRFDFVKGNEMQRFVPNELGCTQDSLEERQRCLMDMPARNFSGVALKTWYLQGMGYFDFPMRWVNKFGMGTEYLGFVYTDPTVFNITPRDLVNAAFTPSSKIKVIISTTRSETSAVSQTDLPPHYQAPHCFFNDETQLNKTLGQLFDDLTNDPDNGMLEKTYQMYPGLSSQHLWDLITTDIRCTCPTNDVAVAMARSPRHEIYRLYISASVGDLGVPAFHMWDTIALFGLKFEDFENIFPKTGDRDRLLGRKLVEMIKNFSRGIVDDRWETFPTNSMELGDGARMDEVIVGRPEEEQCKVLEERDLLKYGWQN